MVLPKLIASGLGAGVEAELHLLEARGVEAAAEADQALQDRRGRVGLHRVIDAGERQGVGQRPVVLLDPVDVEHEAGRGQGCCRPDTGRS